MKYSIAFRTIRLELARARMAQAANWLCECNTQCHSRESQFEQMSDPCYYQDYMQHTRRYLRAWGSLAVCASLYDDLCSPES